MLFDYLPCQKQTRPTCYSGCYLFPNHGLLNNMFTIVWHKTPCYWLGKVLVSNILHQMHLHELLYFLLGSTFCIISFCFVCVICQLVLSISYSFQTCPYCTFCTFNFNLQHMAFVARIYIRLFNAKLNE